MDRRHPVRRLFESVVVQAGALLLIGLYLVPMLFIVAMSLRPSEEVFSRPGALLPDHIRTANYPDAVQSADFGRFFLNSLGLSIAGTALQVVLSCLAGYALARIQFRGRNLLFLAIIGLLIIPPQITMIPLFILAKFVPFAGGNDAFGQGGIGLLDSYPGLLLPHLINPLGIFLMRQFYLSLPEELADAVRVDGGTDWTVLWKIFTPLSKPAVVIVAIFSFQGVWNDFLWPLIITQRNELKTLQLGLTVFFQENTTAWPLLMAGVLLASVPVILLFLFAQRYFTAGIGAGALKG